MSLTKMILAAAFAVAALASPLQGPGGQEGSNSVSESGITTLGQAAAQCGNGQVISCCNQGDKSSQGGLIGSVLDGVLGGSCDALDVTVIGEFPMAMPSKLQYTNALTGVSVPITNACNGQVACCTGDQNVSLSNVPP